MLLGSCPEGNHRLLVHDYVRNGSLDQHLSSKKGKHFSNWGFCEIETERARRPLSWVKKMKIALGAATGLQYLHENNIIHRDMMPNNILVTHDYEALVQIRLGN